MTQFAPLSSPDLPILSALVTAASDRAGIRILEFFTATIRNPHTRRAYASMESSGSWCSAITPVGLRKA
jgi:integrase/recombinase XerC